MFRRGGLFVRRSGHCSAEIRKTVSNICGCRAVSTGTLEVPTAPVKVFAKYVNHIFRSKSDNIEVLFEAANALHQNLKLTIEYEVNIKIPFLDMMHARKEDRVSASWYHKFTETGLHQSYHACASVKCKRNIVEVMAHRIHHATSTWVAFDIGLQKLKKDCLRVSTRPSLWIPSFLVRLRQYGRVRLLVHLRVIELPARPPRMSGRLWCYRTAVISAISLARGSERFRMWASSSPLERLTSLNKCDEHKSSIYSIESSSACEW